MYGRSVTDGDGDGDGDGDAIFSKTLGAERAPHPAASAAAMPNAMHWFSRIVSGTVQEPGRGRFHSPGDGFIPLSRLVGGGSPPSSIKRPNSSRLRPSLIGTPLF